MSLKIGGVDPTKIMVAGTPATKIMCGDQIAWQAIRKITITATYDSSAQQYRWDVDGAAGSTELIVAPGGSASTLISFPVPMTCSRMVNRGAGTISAGAVINAGLTVGARTTQAHIFTEVTP
ncbi:hypothetical protein YH66_11765 [[Brevibacterium] flavum]|uniref:Uncharacterized protein n=1 Tax=[Brevibacterium] flavum TaxID=92706 RepID=A0A0F6SRL7_9CORY|nr:hypothetical protein YH66_11765 [[Brevibacterium] flavum]ANE09009.1 hypothetical protein A3654_11835 [Corynebacterium glutamicum]AST21420.1 hypothetical protein CEY17_11935 [Corynebacterium glutamicum ATCC 14067]KEI23950.1 hypothetical protein KIQ_015730 [Corynebacterium glutamicum ATCC 14067]KIH72976.1 hypothetical protein SD36_11820 [Corynebacterium glutamicum]